MLFFPDVATANCDGVLAVGGDLSAQRLILAYKSGIFPWYNPGEKIIWWAPKKRMILFPQTFLVSKGMRQIMRKENFEITFNQNFKEVIYNCSNIERVGQKGTWISDEMIEAYCNLNEQGIAKSIEVWHHEQLVGGLYGIDLGDVFCGESMFSIKSNASKIAFMSLVDYLKANQYRLLDCQIYNNHLASLGCIEINRKEFMMILSEK